MPVEVRTQGGERNIITFKILHYAEGEGLETGTSTWSSISISTDRGKGEGKRV